MIKKIISNQKYWNLFHQNVLTTIFAYARFFSSIFKRHKQIVGTNNRTVQHSMDIPKAKKPADMSFMALYLHGCEVYFTKMKSRAICNSHGFTFVQSALETINIMTVTWKWKKVYRKKSILTLDIKNRWDDNKV